MTISNAKGLELAALGLDEELEEEEETSKKISEKINNIIIEGLVNVEPKPKRVVEGPTDSENDDDDDEDDYDDDDG